MSRQPVAAQEWLAARRTRLSTVRHDYRDSDGRLVFQRLRQRFSDGSKVVTYRHRSSGVWISEKPAGADGLLYRLPQLLSALAEQAPEIYWAEGESDADALVRTGVPATSHHGGAGKATAEQARTFVGYRGVVNVCVDLDAPGAYDAVRRWRLLHDQAGLKRSALRLVAPMVGKDVRDHLEAGYGVAELRRLRLDRVKRDAAAFNPFDLGSYTAADAEDSVLLLEIIRRGWKPRRISKEEAS